MNTGQEGGAHQADRQAKLLPVLALADPEAGIAQLCEAFGFKDLGQGRVGYGDLTVLVSDGAEGLSGFLPLRMDHLALKVPDLGPVLAQMPTKFSRVTPEGPREIEEFWETGVRYVFFDAPEDWPLEFCTLRGGGGRAHGLDHFGLRVATLAPFEATLESMGAVCVARHQLGAVNVSFLRRAGQVFELFDEPPVEGARTVADGDLPLRGWCGFVPED
ncbi:hypothetical protein [Albirhodobacter sp. R86504]|jgi:catechol 2,3-dioxygenase-like lactoylglutathione lyase family enzyme|uniref:hypothetical protein n=1 Tax=Albirhodobacter sp. R86504 TaxID=3093848 RepID=UPI00366BB77A